MRKDILIPLAVFIALCVFLRYYFDEPTGTVYGCSEKNLPKEAEQECRHIREFKHPVMRDGCIYQESHGKVIRTCG